LSLLGFEGFNAVDRLASEEGFERLSSNHGSVDIVEDPKIVQSSSFIIV